MSADILAIMNKWRENILPLCTHQLRQTDEPQSNSEGTRFYMAKIEKDSWTISLMQICVGQREPLALPLACSTSRENARATMAVFATNDLINGWREVEHPLVPTGTLIGGPWVLETLHS